MPTIISHAVVGVAVAQMLTPQQGNLAFTATAALCAMLPDIDGIGLRLGVPYESVFGHRGFTHSLCFAAIVALIASIPWWRTAEPPMRLRIILCLFLATASHGFLDALTDGGLGVAFLAPFDNVRYFFPVRPIRVSPLSVSAVLSERGRSVLLSELAWVWLPSLLCIAFSWLIQRNRMANPP